MECRKHNHGSNKGVCSSCLRDKLSKLPNTTSYYVIYRSDSNSSSTVDSSPRVKDLHRRAGSMSFALSGNHLIEAFSGGLKKSRSMAHHNHTEELKSTVKKKKSGFWTKLLRLKSKGGGGGGSEVGGFVSNSRQRVY